MHQENYLNCKNTVHLAVSHNIKKKKPFKNGNKLSFTRITEHNYSNKYQYLNFRIIKKYLYKQIENVLKSVMIQSNLSQISNFRISITGMQKNGCQDSYEKSMMHESNNFTNKFKILKKWTNFFKNMSKYITLFIHIRTIKIQNKCNIDGNGCIYNEVKTFNQYFLFNLLMANCQVPNNLLF